MDVPSVVSMAKAKASRARDVYVEEVLQAFVKEHAELLGLVKMDPLSLTVWREFEYEKQRRQKEGTWRLQR